jgi:predicted nucleotidyltransferase
MDDVLARLRTAAPGVFADLPVRVAYLFGSHARGEASQLSDVDVALLAPDIVPYERLNLRLRAVGRLSTAAHIPDFDLDVIVLDESPLTLTGRVIRDGVVIYSVDEPLRAEYESRVFREFVDFSLLGDEIDLEMLRQIADGRR